MSDTLAVTGQDLGDWINAPSANPEALTLIAHVASEAVDELIGSANVPAQTRRLAILITASDLWERRSAPNGIRGFGPDGLPVRIRNDQLASARVLLASWLPPPVD